MHVPIAGVPIGRGHQRRRTRHRRRPEEGTSDSSKGRGTDRDVPASGTCLRGYDPLTLTAWPHDELSGHDAWTTQCSRSSQPRSPSTESSRALHLTAWLHLRRPTSWRIGPRWWSPMSAPAGGRCRPSMPTRSCVLHLRTPLCGQQTPPGVASAWADKGHAIAVGAKRPLRH